jgi:hypothetical protein
MTDWVRCQNGSGQFTLSRKAAEGLEGVKILDGRPAVDAVGRTLPAKPRTSKGGNTEKASRRTGTEKES